MRIPTVVDLDEKGNAAQLAGEEPPAGPRRSVLILVTAILLLLAAGALTTLVVFSVLRERSASAGTPTVMPGQAPTIALTPAQGGYGTLLTVEGQGWPANDGVTIAVLSAAGGGAAIPFASANAGRDGTWRATFRLSDDGGWGAGVTVRVMARGQASGKVATADFFIAPPSPTMTPAATTVVALPSATPTRLPSATPSATPSPTAVPATPTPALPATPFPVPTATLVVPLDWWRGEYFANPDLQGAPALTREDLTLNFNWSDGAPAPGMPADRFSARWTRSLFFESGDYRFALTVDDGARLWIDGQLALDGWSVGATRTYQRDVALAAGYHNIEVDYFEQIGFASISLGWTPAPTYQNWKGEYFPNADLTGAPLTTRDDLTIDFNWATGAPVAGLPADGFSVRWTRTIWLEEGAYSFHSNQDDGMRAWVDDAPVIEHWRDGSLSEDLGYRFLESGWHRIRVEYYDRAGPAVARFQWQRLLDFSDWRGEYFANADLAGRPAAMRNDRFINFDWSNVAPLVGMPAMGFSVRWTQMVNLAGGTTRFICGADDGIRLWLDEQLLADHWQEQLYREWTVERGVSAGPHTLRVEYYQRTGQARVMLRWEAVAPAATSTPTRTVVQTTRPTTSPTRTATLRMPPTSTRTVTRAPGTGSATPSRTGTRPATTPTATGTRGALPVTVTPWPTLTPEPTGRRLTLLPAAVLAGEKVRISGERAPAGAALKVGLAEYGQSITSVQWLTEALADDSGAFSAVIETPAIALGLVADGFVVVAYAPQYQALWAGWLPLGQSLVLSRLDTGSQTPLLTEAPFARVFLSRAEWERYHQPAKRTLGALFGALERRLLLVEPSFLDAALPAEIDWTHYAVVEVSLGKSGIGQSVEIVSAARTREGVQVVLRVTARTTSEERGAGAAIPFSAMLISRDALGQEAVPVVFLTTLGQRLPTGFVQP